MANNSIGENLTLVGFIERITFQNPENGFTVARLQEARKSGLTTLVGIMPGLAEGETVNCKGSWKNDLIHGSQFSVKQYEVRVPADVNGIRKYLASGLVKGIGPKYAKEIVERFGAATLEVIDSQPNELLKVPGIGKKRLQLIEACWEEQKSIRDVMVFLQGHGVSPTYAQKIFRAYGSLSIEKVTTNPYSLARDIFGIGFQTADKIATQLGIEPNSPQRIEAGIEFVLAKLSDDGHTCYPSNIFIEEAQKKLEVPPTLISDSMLNLHQEKRIVLQNLTPEEEEFIWLRPFFLSEAGIARELKRLKSENTKIRSVDTEKALEWVQGRLHFALEKNQSHAIAKALSEKVMIITGGPGTGKSTITNALLYITEKLTSRILLAAPTGRAAKRMSEITNKHAKTIHSLLAFDFKVGGFKHNQNNPLECDLLIIDEASMIDTILMYSLLKAIPDHARLIFVGDINQLPSVGPGNVLKDLINSQSVPVSQLTEIFRQAKGSQIITNAHKINRGEFPYLKNRPNSDFFFLEEDEPEKIIETILGLIKKRLPDKYKFDPLEEIQILSPMRRGAIGTESLNQKIQTAINPSANPLLRAGKQFHVKDKVMQIRNNYKKEVYNGDVGYIQEINLIEQQVSVEFSRKIVTYSFSELDELNLAYAVSIHKYQGSECPCVIIPIHTSHFKLLHRNLLYTAVTRGKKLVILIGSKKAIAIAIHNHETLKRHTSLLQSLETVNRI